MSNSRHVHQVRVPKAVQAVCLAALLLPTVAHAFDVTIAAASGNGGWTGNTWTPSGANSTVAASEIEAHLATGDVTIIATDSDALTVSASLTWSANVLILSAGGDIAIQAAQHGSGTAGLALAYGQANMASGNASTYNVNAPVNLASTGNFSTKLGSDGTVKNYTVITSLGSEGSTTGTDLQGINGNLAGNYVLGADIDAGATSGWNGGAGFMAIAGSDDGLTGPNYFTGQFDGLGHVISDLTINRSTTGVGLFGQASSGARIAHVGLSNASIVGLYRVGGLLGFGYAGGTLIEKSYVTGTVTGSDYVGGILGQDVIPVSSVTLRNVWSSADVTATTPGTGSGSGGGGVVGGLSGYGGKIYDSYATGNVRGGNQVGGLIGWGQVTINNAYFSGTVGTYAGTSYSVAGILGYWFNPSLGAVTNAYWNTDTAGATGIGHAGTGTPTNLTGLTTAQMRDAANFAGFSFTSTPGGSGWVLIGSDGTLNGSNGTVLPMLASEWSPVIKNTHQLQLMAMNLGGSYTLANNLDASVTNGGANDVWLSSSFVPVGTSATRFTGSFDGQNRALDAVYIRTLAGGLFRDIGSGGTVRDLSITNADAAADFGGSAATLVRNNYGTVSNVFASGTLTGYNTVGGLVWKNFGLIDRSGTDIVIQAVTQGAGLAGWNLGTITNSYALGTVSALGGIRDVLNVTALSNAGLVSQNTGSISTSYVSGLVAGGHEVSGLVAHNFPTGTINDCYSTATIIPYKSYSVDNYFGGIAAINEGTVSLVYYVGVWDRMNDAYSLGGAYALITAEDPSHGGTCTGCVGVRKGYYFDYTVSTNEHFLEAQPAAGTLVIGGTPEATALWDKYHHASVFADAGFDISTVGGSSAVWRIYEGSSTPLLRTVLTPLTITADNVSKTYDGAGYAGGLANPGYSVAGAEASGHLFNLASPYAGYVNVGSYDPDIWSDQQGYDIAYVNAHLTIDAGPTYTVTVNVGAGGTASCSPLSAGGGSTITCTATPDAGNLFTGWTGGCSASFILTGDLTCTAGFAHDPLVDPDTSLVSATPAVSPTTSTTMSFTFNGTDDLVVTSYECALDGTGYQSCSSPQSYTALADGAHTFNVRAVDGDGNKDPSPASHAWTVDTTAPVLSAVGVSGTTQTGTTLAATSHEAATGYWIVVARGATAPSAAQVKSGTGYGSVSIIAQGSGAMTAAATRTFAVAGLSMDTDYDLYLVAEDALANISAPLLTPFSTPPGSHFIVVTSTTGGSASCTPNPVNHGSDSACAATANTGYVFSHWSGDCAGTACNLVNVTAERSVTAHFDEANATFGPIPTHKDGVTATISVTGCGTVDSAAFVDAPASGPANRIFSYGLLDFTLSQCGATATVTVSYSEPLPDGTFYKETAGVYALYPATVAGNIISFVLTDNGSGDDDAALGAIHDPSGLAVAVSSTGARPIPALAPWTLVALSFIVFGASLRHRRIETTMLRLGVRPL